MSDQKAAYVSPRHVPAPEGETRVGSFEAKTHFAQLMDRVEQGEEIVITRHGRAVMKLVPYRPARDKEKIREAIATMRELAKHNGPITREEILGFIKEGRRF